MKKQFFTDNGIIIRELTENETCEEFLAEYNKNKSISDNLPSWNAVNNAIQNIDNMQEARAFLLKLSRVVYDLAKTHE